MALVGLFHCLSVENVMYSLSKLVCQAVPATDGFGHNCTNSTASFEVLRIAHRPVFQFLLSSFSIIYHELFVDTIDRCDFGPKRLGEVCMIPGRAICSLQGAAHS